MLPAFSALIFDLDGTLVDSAAVVDSVLEQWCRRHGIPFERAMEISHGARTVDTVRRVAPHLPAEEEARHIEEKEHASLHLMQPVGGALEFLAGLDPVFWAVATSSTRLTAGPKLEASGLPVPAVLVTADCVASGKPHPEPFLKAAAGLGVPPERCLVFEDACHGANAALAAGCRVILVGPLCRMEHPRILGRITSYGDLSLTGDGILLLHARPIARRLPAGQAWRPGGSS